MLKDKLTTVGKMKKEAEKRAVETIVDIEKIVAETEKKLENKVVPIREGVIKRYPVLFLMAATFGLTATVLGMEKIIERFDFLRDRPELILFLGISTLFMTGTAYKKLG